MSLNSFRSSQSATPAVINLILINAVVFVAQIVLDNSPTDPGWFTNFLALKPYMSSYFSYYQLITHMFAHGGFLHILFNMYALWLFGSVLERKWGTKKFLIFYFVCGLAAAFSQAFLTNDAAIGASGAVMGLLAAFAVTFPNVQFYILPLPFPIKAKWLAVIYAAIDIFGGISSNDNVAHLAHLGGLVMGLILALVWKQQERNTRYR